MIADRVEYQPICCWCDRRISGGLVAMLDHQRACVHRRALRNRIIRAVVPLYKLKQQRGIEMRWGLITVVLLGVAVLGAGIAGLMHWAGLVPWWAVIAGAIALPVVSIIALFLMLVLIYSSGR